MFAAIEITIMNLYQSPGISPCGANEVHGLHTIIHILPETEAILAAFGALSTFLLSNVVLMLPRVSPMVDIPR